MGNWEKTFGAGYSAESMIRSFNNNWKWEQRELERQARRERNLLNNYGIAYDRFPGDEMFFPTFEEAEAWIRANLDDVEYMQRPCGSGYVIKSFCPE